MLCILQEVQMLTTSLCLVLICFCACKYYVSLHDYLVSLQDTAVYLKTKRQESN